MLSITSNGNFPESIFCGHKSGLASMIDIEKKQVIRYYSPLDSITNLYPTQTKWSLDPIHSIAIHPTYPLIAVGTRYGAIHMFDIRDPKACVSFKAHADSIAQVAFHPWFNTILSSGYDGSLRMWCARDRVLLHQYNVGLENSCEIENGGSSV